MGAKRNKGRYNVRVLERAIRLLFTLSDAKGRNLTQIAQQAQLNSSTAFRLLSTLEYHRFVQRDRNDGQYRLGPACLDLARAYVRGIDVVQTSMPVLEELRDYTRETVHLAVLDRMEVYYLAKIPGYHAIGLMSSRAGSSAPAYCTGLGKALLAFLPEGEVRAYYAEQGLEPLTSNTITDIDTLIAHLETVRKKGYALDLGEREPGVYCVAAPIQTEDGEMVAAISVSGPAYRMKAGIEEGSLIHVVHEAARSIAIRTADQGRRIVPPR
jgi:DNA-binding IclR family transcriptional regulator